MASYSLSNGIVIANVIHYGSLGLAKDQIKAFFESIEHSQDPDLLLEAMTMEELEDAYRNDSEPLQEMILEAITTQRRRLDRTMAAFKRALTQAMSGTEIDVSNPVIGKPRKSGLAATMTALFPFSDGQSLSIIFHAPDNDPMDINMEDTLIAFRFMLNKTDITNVVSPHNGRDISLKQTVTAVSNLVERNSANFQAKQEVTAARKAEIEQLESQLEAEAEMQGQLADDIDVAKDTLADLTDRKAHFESIESTKRTRIEELKAQISALKKAGNGADKSLVARIKDLNSIEQLEGKERYKAISKAVKAEFKRIGVSPSVKLQSQKTNPLIDVRIVKDGAAEIPAKTQELLLSISPAAKVGGTFAYFLNTEDWLQALRVGFAGGESASKHLALLPQLEELFQSYEKSTGRSAEDESQQSARAYLAEHGWTKFSDDYNDLAESLFETLILNIRNKLFAQGAEYFPGGNQYNTPWPLVVDGINIEIKFAGEYLADGYWSSAYFTVGNNKFPFTAESDTHELVSRLVAEARKQAAQNKIDNEPSINEDGTQDVPQSNSGGLVQGDKFTVGDLEYELVEVPETPDGYIKANGGVMGGLGGEQWEGYERFKEETGQTIAKFEKATQQNGSESFSLELLSYLNRMENQHDIRNLLELVKKLEQAGVNFPSPAEFVADIESGNRRGYSLSELNETLRKSLSDRQNLVNNHITAKRIIGEGGKKKDAIAYLDKEISELQTAIESGGFAHEINIKNYKHTLNQIQAGERDERVSEDEVRAIQKRQLDQLEQDEKASKALAERAATAKSYEVGSKSNLKSPMSIKYTVPNIDSLLVRLAEAKSPHEKYEVLKSSDSAKLKEMTFKDKIALRKALKDGIEFSYFSIAPRKGYNLIDLIIDLQGDSSESQEIADALTTLQRLTDGEIQDMDEFDRLLDEAANTLEQAGLMEKYDSELNAAADAFTALLERESEGV